MTLAELRGRVRYRLGLRDDAATDAMIDSYLNEAYRDALTRTRCTVQVATLDLTPGVSEYTIDPLIALVAIGGTISGQGRTLEPLGLNDLLARQRVAAAGTTTYYAITGADLLGLYPAPSAGDSLTFHYVPVPDLLDTDEDEVQLIPAEFQHLIEDYALWKLADADDDSSSASGERYRDHYLNGCEDAKRAIRKKQGTRRSRVSVNARRRVGVRHSRDQDV